MKEEFDKKRGSSLNIDDAVKSGLSRKSSFLPVKVLSTDIKHSSQPSTRKSRD